MITLHSFISVSSTGIAGIDSKENVVITNIESLDGNVVFRRWKESWQKICYH